MAQSHNECPPLLIQRLGELRVRRIGRGVLLEPVDRNADDSGAILAELDRHRDTPFMEDGRQQPAMPPEDDVTLDR